MTGPELALRHYDTHEAGKIIGLLVAVHQEIYANTEPREFFTEARYRRQLNSHMTAPGWELVTAHAGDELAGYAYGFPLPAGSRWWRGLLTPLTNAEVEETGSRTFALSELMVRTPWRGWGLGRKLHDELLSGRGEDRATLLVEPGNAVARAAYERWGWVKLGDLRPGWDSSPVFEALVRPLPLR